MSKTAYAAVGIAALAMGAAGCGSSNNSSSDNSSASTPAPAATQTQAKTTAAAAGGASTIALGATEFKFDPGTLNAKSGEVTFDLKNNGAIPHALEIEGKGVEAKTSIINGGQSTTLKVKLKPGKYEFYCPVDGHRQQGMEGTLTVT